MSKRKKFPATSDAVDQAYGMLDQALRATGRLLAEDENDIRSSESEIDLDGIELPRSLHDPMATLELGRQVLNHGFPPPSRSTPASGSTRQGMTQAARNGTHISDDLRHRMHRDRHEATNKSNKA